MGGVPRTAPSTKSFAAASMPCTSKDASLYLQEVLQGLYAFKSILRTACQDLACQGSVRTAAHAPSSRCEWWPMQPRTGQTSRCCLPLVRRTPPVQRSSCAQRVGNRKSHLCCKSSYAARTRVCGPTYALHAYRLCCGFQSSTFETCKPMHQHRTWRGVAVTGVAAVCAATAGCASPPGRGTAGLGLAASDGCTSDFTSRLPEPACAAGGCAAAACCCAAAGLCAVALEDGCAGAFGSRGASGCRCCSGACCSAGFMRFASTCIASTQALSKFLVALARAT